MNYHTMTDTDFLNLIFTEGDSLGMEYIENAGERSDAIVPMLCDVLTNEENYMWDGTARWWSVVHAAHILGILGDDRAVEGLLKASEYSYVYGIDWIMEILPECYRRLGPGVIPRLKEHITERRSSEATNVLSEILGLWNIWKRLPDTREDIETFLFSIMISPETDYGLKTHIIADFAQINRTDLRPLFEEFYEKGEVDLDVLTRNDLDYFFDKVNYSPELTQDIASFYSSEEIEKRRVRWENEDERGKTEELNDFILDNCNRIGRNEQCPCGSGKKFKKCHLAWAEETLRQLRKEEQLFESKKLMRFAISVERQSETALRRMLAAKDKTSLFLNIKAKVIEVIKIPTDQFTEKGFLSHFEPLFSQIEFDSKEDLGEFTQIFIDYYNALAQQYLEYPRDKQHIHS